MFKREDQFRQNVQIILDMMARSMYIISLNKLYPHDRHKQGATSAFASGICWDCCSCWACICGACRPSDWTKLKPNMFKEQINLGKNVWVNWALMVRSIEHIKVSTIATITTHNASHCLMRLLLPLLSAHWLVRLQTKRLDQI